MFHPMAERQKCLRVKFNFRCYCNRCERPQLYSRALKSNRRIKSDPNFQLLDDVVHEPGCDYRDVLSLKANAYRLLKKYKSVAWCEEIFRIIYDLYTIALIETNRASGGIQYNGRPFNVYIE